MLINESCWVKFLVNKVISPSPWRICKIHSNEIWAIGKQEHWYASKDWVLSSMSQAGKIDMCTKLLISMSEAKTQDWFI